MRFPISLSSHSKILTSFKPSQFQYSPVRFLASSCKMSSKSSPTFSSNYDPDQGTRDLELLLNENGGKWTLIESGKGVERSFRFKTFKRTWEFMNIIAAECVVKKHHPEWSNVYNTTFIRWTTHSPPGLSEKDVSMARFCDEKAQECGEVEVEEGKDEEGVGKELADRVATEGAECCVPKKKSG